MNQPKLLKKLLLICLLPVFDTATAQVLNENYNHLIEFRQSNGLPIINQYGHTLTFNTTTDQDNTVNPFTFQFSACVLTDFNPSEESANQIFSTQTQGPFYKTDLSIHGFMKLSELPSLCTFSNDFSNIQQTYLLNDPRLVPKNASNYNDFTLNPANTFSGGTADLRFRNYWRYGAGTRLKNTALEFGQIPLGGTREHINNNYPAPYNNTAAYGSYGYSNRYSPVGGFNYTNNMQNSADVSYTFTLPANAYVTITTDDPLTNFDTYIHLVTLSSSGFLDFNPEVISDDNSGANGSSTISRFLCNPSATYGIIVEGKDGAAISNGTFKLKIKVEFIIAGSIETGHYIPNPQELFPDFVSNVSAPSPNVSSLISWEKSTDGGNNWEVIPGASNIAYALPVVTQETQYRRRLEGCFGGFLNSNTAIISVVNPNGVISGKVTSLNGITGIKGIEVIAYKNGISLSGSPAGFTYRDTTDDQGEYSIQPIYYGRTNITTSTPFVVKPIKPGHRFDRDSLIKTLTNLIPTSQNVNFIDSTGYAITGKTYQECTDCNNSTSGLPEFQACPLDSVRIASNVSGVLPVISGFDGSEYGRYGLVVQNPGSNNLTASYRNHLFTPPIRNVNIINSDVENIDFKDTSTHVISGKLTAGCVDFIGTAVLEFSDILPTDAQNNPRSSCFNKRVTTAEGSGFFSIRLPARKYKARVVSFTPTSDVSSPDLLAFFNAITGDSLTRDITERDTTLNFVYQRPPVMVLEGLNNDCNRAPADSAFAVFPQSITKTMLIRIYQGPAVKACPVPDSSIVLINTNIQKDDANESFSHKTKNGIDTLVLTGGTPNIVSPYYKTLNIQFTDQFGRQATPVNRNVVVTGLKANIGTFTTVSPQIPLMVLHDPPGDLSSSFWETTQTNETAMRFYTADEKSASLWAAVKVGAEVETGIAVSTQTSVWGTINGSVGVAARNTTADETIVSTSTTSTFSTSDNPNVTGGSGDVFIGAALNLKYAIANEITYTPPCLVNRQQKLMIANTGFNTQYIYSESHISNTLIPNLRLIRDLSTDSAQRNNYDNQIAIWEQVLANNEDNKRRAVFDRNISFDGNVGAYGYTTTSSSTKSSTVEFALELNAAIAAELGFESAGSGISGGVNVEFKMETGNSKTNTSTRDVTMGFTLDDDDDQGDFFSVNIKKDPVYNTPVFEMVAGTSSCPVEPGTQPRDEMQLVAPVPVVSGVAADGEAEFILLLSNTSQSLEERTYQLSFDQASNPNGAVVTVGGSPVLVPIPYTIGYLGQVQVVVKVRRGASNVYSYEGLKFVLTDGCDEPNIEKTVSVSAYFNSACSNIVLSEPANNWTSTTLNNNILPVLFKGYTLANLTSVTLEYSQAGLSNWTEGFTRTAAQINNSINGTLVNWNIAGLADGNYNLRLRLNCASGIVYSERVTGTIDRKGPVLFGTQQPSDDNYVTGDVISARYNENIDCASITNTYVKVKRLSNNQVIDAAVGCYQNEVVIVPVSPIAGFVGDTIQVTLQNIPDIYGNVKATNDIWKFTIGNTIPDASSKAVKLVVGNTGAGAGGRIGFGILESNTASILENSGDSIVYRFKLPVNAPNDIRVNYIISGNSIFNTDYIVANGQAPTQSTSYDGSRGTIIIKQGTRAATLKIKPIANVQASNNKTITLSLAEGGDYLLGDSTAASGTIINDDLPATYTFIGNGNFTETANWQNGLVPPYNTIIYDEIIINPAGNGECILNVPLRMREGAKLTVLAGKKFIVNGNMRIANQ